MLRLDGHMAIVDRFTEASADLIATGMTPLGAKTIKEVLTYLRQTRT